MIAVDKHISDGRDPALCSCGFWARECPVLIKREAELLHKWLGGQSAEFIQKHGRQSVLDMLAVVERRRGHEPYTDVTIRATGEKAADRIMKQLDNRMTGEPKPSRKQAGMVLKALADHTAIMEMVQFDRRSRVHPEREEELWPTETSVGRWFHHVGDDLEGRFQ